MDRNNEYHQLLYVDPDKDYGFGDFSGSESRVSEEERKEYLKEYCKAAHDWWPNTAKKPEQVVSSAEASEWTKNLRRAPISDLFVTEIDRVSAYTAAHAEEYENLCLFTDRVREDAGTLRFHDGDVGPMGAALWIFGDGAKGVAFRFHIDADFAADLVHTPLVTTVTGRLFELRSGIRDFAKFQVYTTGELWIKEILQTIYHPKMSKLAEGLLGTDHTVQILLQDEKYEVILDGTSLGAFVSPDFLPDRILFHSGMQPHGHWEVTPLYHVDALGCKVDFRPKKASTDRSETPLGEVVLPYCIGTKKNIGKDLILEKSLVLHPKKARYILALDSVDPCGTLTVNGKNVTQIGDFLSKKIDITDYVTDGENVIRVHVFPRAPEVFYTWHRHDDPQCGWFCGKMRLLTVKRAELDDVKIETLGISDGKVRFRISGKTTAPVSGFVCVSMKKSFPTESREDGICKIPVDADGFSYAGECAADLWDTDTPNLYSFRLRLYDNGEEIYAREYETGFRTIENKNGEILLNGKKIMMNGALIMQFIPPYENVPAAHVCPTDEQIVWQYLCAKKMNCNTLRLHVLGYGTNDERFAYYADRLGILLLWTTQLIDIGECCVWDEKARYIAAYQSQMMDVINHPSIAVWEASNEFHGDLAQIDRLYNDFTKTVKEVDTTRLILPCAHLYYAGGIYDTDGCNYYQDDGTSDADFCAAKSGEGWTDPLVIRSSHTYSLLLGYGDDYKRLRLQDWKSQPSLLESKTHAYLITEFAVIGKQDPTTDGAKEFYNPNSYELSNERGTLGFDLSADEWELSQALQALCAEKGVRRMRAEDVDGMLWCCLLSGANNASYLKPPLDFFGYPKLAYYALRESFVPTYAALATTATHCNKFSFCLELYSYSMKTKANVSVAIDDGQGNTVFRKTYDDVKIDAYRIPLDTVTLPGLKKGYYRITTKTEDIL